ncbi:MAG: phage tail protein, partial [Thalassolituus sp.]
MRLIGFNSGGIVVTSASYIGEAWNSFIRLCFGESGDIWTFSDRGTDDGDDSEILRLDPSDGSVLATINMDIDTRPIDILSGNPATGGDIWVVEYTQNEVLRVSETSETIIATIAVCDNPIQAATDDDGFIWVAGETGQVTKIDPSDNSTVTYDGDLCSVTSPGDYIWSRASSQAGGAMWLVCTEGWVVKRFEADGTSTTVRAGERPQSCAFATGVLDDVWVTCSNGLYRISQDATVHTLFTPPTNVASHLPAVVNSLCAAAGLAVSQYDTSDLPNDVVAARSPLEQLALAYNFHLVERDFALVFQRIGQEAIAAIIPEDELCLPETADDAPGVQVTRIEDLSLPTRLEFKYVSIRRNYQDNTQPGWVTTQQNPARNDRVVSVQVGLIDFQGKQRAQEMIDRLWIEREQFAFTLTRKYAYLEPGDRIQLTLRSVQHTILLTDRAYGRPGRIEFKGVSDSSFSQYVLQAKPGVVNPGKQFVGYLRNTEALLL